MQHGPWLKAGMGDPMPGSEIDVFFELDGEILTVTAYESPRDEKPFATEKYRIYRVD